MHHINRFLNWLKSFWLFVPIERVAPEQDKKVVPWTGCEYEDKPFNREDPHMWC